MSPRLKVRFFADISPDMLFGGLGQAMPFTRSIAQLRLAVTMNVHLISLFA